MRVNLCMATNCTQVDKLSARTLLKQRFGCILFRSVGHPLQVWGCSLFRCVGWHPLQVWGCIRGIYEQPHRQPRRTRLPEWGGELT